MKSLGYRVLSAASANEAIAIVESAVPIDLMLSDIVLPGGKDGKATAAQVLCMRPGLPVLFMSGYTDHTDFAIEGLNDAPVLLRKPFRRAELAERLDEVLASCRQLSR